MKRRNVVKGLALLPVAGSIFAGKAMAAPAAEASADVLAEANVFRAIGVEPLINCRGTFTIIGGSLERPAVRQAMEAASRNFVQYDELADGIGQRLADLTGAEWGMVSAGCAAGLKHITAACVTGGNPERLIRIPNLTGFEKTEVIIPRYSRNVYDHAIRNIGVTIVHVTTAEELQKAINPKTALIYVTAGTASDTGQPLSLEVIAGIAKPKNVPVLIDAAAENLTLPPVHLKRGATIVAYSGGKAICGPQCAGLMLGNKDILMSAWQASAPHHGPGRDNKVGREEMMGMLAAVEDWTKRDHDADWKRWLVWLGTISKKVSTIDGITTKVDEQTGLSNKSPVLNISWNAAKFNLTSFEMAEELGRHKPRIAVGNKDDADGTATINVTTGQMQPGEELIVADRIYAVLNTKRAAKPAGMTAPAANLTGNWDVAVKYFSSSNNHGFTIEQDGNWLQGTHKGDMDTRNLTGTIEGDKIMMRTSVSMIGDNVTFLFSGTVSGDTMTGDVYLGEYRTAKFTAKRNAVKAPRQKILIPAGPPLAT